MALKSIDNLDKEVWNGFIKENALDGGLLQSFEWGDFLASSNQRIWRLAVVNEASEIQAAVLIALQGLPLGKNYLLWPRGPVLNKKIVDKEEGKTVLAFLFQSVAKIAKTEKSIFSRLDPAISEEALKEISGGLSLRFVGQVQPKETLILDLDKSEEALLSEMKPKTRYNIKVAEKNGVEIVRGAQYFEDFWRLMGKTSSRQEIKPHSKRHYQGLVESLGKDGLLEIWVAKLDNKIITANMMIFFGETAVYLHGGSDYDYRDKMAPYLLQWEAIKEAKKRHCRRYDFWGIDEKKWPGVTRFKKGFSTGIGSTIYAGAHDQVYSKLWYNIYNLTKKIF